VRSIAERAGATAAMINYYFGGKQALYDTVVSEVQGPARPVVRRDRERRS
jgi:AcrR family transcriptional regulator